MNIASAIVQIGALAAVIILAITFQKAEREAKTSNPVDLDLSDVPPFLPPPDPETEDET